MEIQPIIMEVWKWASYLIIGLFLIGVFYILAFWYNRTRRYDWVVRIFNKDANGQVIQQKDDRGGIFLDKRTMYRLFLLRRLKFGLDPDEIPYILNWKGQKMVYLVQTGLKNFQFMKPQISDNPGLVFNVQDEDVAWALNAYERHKKNFQNKFLEQIMPIIGMVLVFMLVIVAMYFIFKNFGELSATAGAFKEAADAYARAQLGTTVVGG